MEPLRQLIREAKFADEALLVETLLAEYPLRGVAQDVEARAAALVEGVRSRRSDHTLLDRFLQEYGLANDEGVALMCLAESLLRVPDADTMDALIKDKILPANWATHLGDSASILVNASTWGLMLTGKVIGMESWPGRTPAELVGHLVSRVGEPVIRAAMQRAMHILGREFVLGRTIEEALDRGGDGQAFSFDMLGEAARTSAAADRYFDVYAHAIQVVGGTANGESGVSVKLSALHPRYEYAQRERVVSELLPRLLELCEAAAGADIALSIDAEEADRLELSLDLFERVARSPALEGWQELGIVVQGYGKRALPCIDWVAELARQTKRRINVRLVKGAYWDAEIKHAQESGLPDFPVFTIKANTDLAYLACAAKLLALEGVIFPQFATHNAHTVAAVMALAGDRRGFEFQRLHGMGELLYALARDAVPGFPRLRVYAPVGGHEDLLPYLVRRLLENGANSSFVNRFLDDSTPAVEVVRDPAGQVRHGQAHRHERVRRPAELYGPTRPNSRGWDLTDALSTARLTETLAPFLHRKQQQRLDKPPRKSRKVLTVVNPADHSDAPGRVAIPDGAAIDAAMAAAADAQPRWDRFGGSARADILRAAADLLVANRPELMALLIREAGKTIQDSMSEVREAEDFCRYYADLAQTQFAESTLLPGPTGERNELSLHGRGVFVCISPWNFPLAIFIGQIAGALVAGNAVVAKPAEQTPLIARRAVALLVEAGVPREVLHLVPGGGDVGARLVSSSVTAGVAFTGSTDTARSINLALAKRDGPIVSLIAETGGQNVMIVDSTALLDQVADDVVRSAFGSAGQRCSALRILLVQEEIADRALELIVGAANELQVGDPADLSTDVGPVIDGEALASLRAHIKSCRRAGCSVHVAAGGIPALIPAQGSFLAPHIIEIEDVGMLTAEHFGPILHVVRFATGELSSQLASVRSLGYGLTMGVHSRIEQRVIEVFSASLAGNTYVNRNMIGAVVGVQPFGGFGLSGTGPKAGGPNYLLRFATERTLTVNTMAQGGNIDLLREDP